MPMISDMIHLICDNLGVVELPNEIWTPWIHLWTLIMVCFAISGPHNKFLPFSHINATADMPVEVYIGGVEHTILHFLYSRFPSKVAWKAGLYSNEPEIEAKEDKEPGNGESFKILITQGMVQGQTFENPVTEAFLKPSEVDLTDPSKPIQFLTWLPPNVSWEKMSKSKFNGLDPNNMIASYAHEILCVVQGNTVRGTVVG